MHDGWKPEWGNYDDFLRWVTEQAARDPPPPSIATAAAIYRGGPSKVSMRPKGKRTMRNVKWVAIVIGGLCGALAPTWATGSPVDTIYESAVLGDRQYQYSRWFNGIFDEVIKRNLAMPNEGFLPMSLWTSQRTGRGWGRSALFATARRFISRSPL
jgi:hypothetical protein